MKKDFNDIESKIIFYDELSEEERKEVDEILKTSKKYRDYFNQIRAIEDSLKKSQKVELPDEDLLIRYVNYLREPREPDYDGRKLTREEITRIEALIEKNPLYRKRFEELQKELLELDTFLADSEIPDLEIGRSYLLLDIKDWLSERIKAVGERSEEWLVQLTSRRVLVPVAVVATVLLLVIVNPFLSHTQLTYSDLASLETTQISYLTRSSSETTLQMGVSQFNNGNYSQAIHTLEQLLSQPSNNINIPFTKYVCGLAYLYQVERSVKGNDYSTYTSEINKGITYLLSAAESTDNPRLLENINWYLGKAYLMLNDGSAALRYFEKVKEMKGRKSQEAIQLIPKIEKLLHSVQ